MNLVLLCLWFGDGFWRNHSQLMVQKPGVLLHYDLTQPQKEPQPLQAGLVSINATSAILRRDDHLELLWFKDGKIEPLPDPPLRPFDLGLPALATPGLLAQDQLLLYLDHSWQKVAIPVWYEFTEPRPVPGSRYGQQPLMPDVFSVRGQVYAYQPKSGALVAFDPQTKRVRSRRLAPKLSPVPIGDDLIWIGTPKRDRIGLAGPDPAAPPIDQRTVNDLNDHSLVVPTQRGLWLLTFASGIRDGLKSWDRGTVRVSAQFVRPQSGRLTLQSYDLGNLPVDFALSTSNSGSPKLGVNPAFLPSTLPAGDLLVIGQKTSILWLDSSGKKGIIKYTTGSPPIAFGIAGNGLEIYHLKGHQFYPWERAP